MGYCWFGTVCHKAFHGCVEQSPCQQLVVKPVYLYQILNPLALMCQLAGEHPSCIGVVIDVMTGGCVCEIPIEMLCATQVRQAHEYQHVRIVCTENE